MCAPLWRRRGLSESSSLTHSVSDEILKSASLDKLGYQIEPLVLVKHADEPQNVGMIEASHDFDLKRLDLVETQIQLKTSLPL